MSNDAEVLKQFFVPLLLMIGTVVVVIALTFRRGLRIRNEVLRLHGDYDRVTQHLQLRLAAQKRDAEARQATGAAQVQGLREALELWHQAAATRNVDDEDGYEMIRTTINMLEEDLRALGAEPGDE